MLEPLGINQHQGEVDQQNQGELPGQQDTRQPECPAVRMMPAAMATGTGSLPEAIGRFFFTGCWRSASRSEQVVEDVDALEMRQNRPNPASVRRKSVRWKSLPSKTSEAKMKDILRPLAGAHGFQEGFEHEVILHESGTIRLCQKVRLDLLLVERGLAESRTKAQALVMAGQVRVDGQVELKASTAIDPECAPGPGDGSAFCLARRRKAGGGPGRLPGWM